MINAQDSLIKIVQGSTINSATTTTFGSGVTLPDCEFVKVIISYGTVTTAAAQTVIAVQTSADDSTYATVHDFITPATGAGTAFVPADTDDNKWLVADIDLRGREHKYIRVRVTTTGTPNFVVNNVVFIGFNNKAVPPTGNVSTSQLATHAL